MSEKRLRYLIKDEKKAAKDYRKMGLPTLARDEARHKRVLERVLKKKLKKRRKK